MGLINIFNNIRNFLEMFKQTAILFVILISMQAFVFANNQRDSDEFVDEQEATQFLKRLFHPFSTKNEEIKRETTEVFEEKCESIIPGQRFCPKLQTWKLFRDYENG